MAELTARQIAGYATSALLNLAVGDENAGRTDLLLIASQPPMQRCAAVMCWLDVIASQMRVGDDEIAIPYPRDPETGARLDVDIDEYAAGVRFGAADLAVVRMLAAHANGQSETALTIFSTLSPADQGHALGIAVLRAAKFVRSQEGAA